MTRKPGTVVVAVGGNALSPPTELATIREQFAHTRASLVPVVELARAGWRIVIVHGNGPQVGDEIVRGELAAERLPPLPLGVLVASTAGWIGYMIQQSLQNACRGAGVERDVVSLITQVVVEPDDPRLGQATKPIGHAIDEARARTLEGSGVAVGQDGDGRWRRMAPSPLPVDVVEAPLVGQLVGEGTIVVAAGGGGTPVVRDAARGWEGVDAVVDKDRVAAVLARRLDADLLLILTTVEGVYRGWGTADASLIPRMNIAEARALLAGDALGKGSMRPKLEAAVEFVAHGGARAVIAHLERGVEALAGTTGTTIEGGDQ